MITVTPDPLVAGGVANVSVSGSSKLGQTITVDIDDGEGHTDSVQITLDGSGKGSKTWDVPTDWEQAKFNYSGCAEVVVDIDPAPPPGE